MAQVTQYPHYLFIEQATESTQDETGEWSESEITRTFVSKCRAESDGKGTEYQVAGGQYIKATALIQLPAKCKNIPIGTKVVITNDDMGDETRVEGICLNFDAGQLHCRLWL